jgi:two-component system, OmpR family, sensor histidine kinase BaeS
MASDIVSSGVNKMCIPPHWPEHIPPWRAGRQHKRRFLIRRFGFVFFLIIMFYLVGLSGLLFLVFRPLRELLPGPAVLLLVVCGLPVVVTLFSALAGGLAFRRIGTPLADVMAAADAVAEGDLSVRVREEAPGEFGQLARSFNRMTAELSRAEQQRRSLTADVAHELRTPLHIIQGNLEGILDGVYQPTSEQIQATLEETRLLARLVTDLQTLSLAEAGQLPLHRERVLATDLLQDVAASFSGPAAQAGVDLSVQVEEGTGNLEINVDPDRIDQVLSNLVSNALRYTQEGGQIVLRVEPSTQIDEAGQGVRFTIKDNGTGIPAEDLPFIFDRFWRGDRARTRGEGAGSGLGLAIARQLVQAHSGRIKADSTPGLGTTFTIDL